MIDLLKTLQKANMTQVELANELGESKQRIWYWAHEGINMVSHVLLTEFFGKRTIKIYYVKSD